MDARASRAIILRRGCGGLKHITVKSLWVQEAVREYSTEIERLSRDEMHAHILASPSSAEELCEHHTSHRLIFTVIHIHACTRMAQVCVSLIASTSPFTSSSSSSL